VEKIGNIKKKAFLDLIEKGYDKKRLAKKFNCTIDYIVLVAKLWNVKIPLPKKTSKYNTEEFINFVKNHTMDEIITVYGKSGKSAVLYRGYTYKRKAYRNGVHNDKYYNILEDLKNKKESQSFIAKKYGVSRQWVQQIKVQNIELFK
jgi:DNA-directed RNA polymerase sigma subunit (sigma70/sigma32)